MKLLHLHLLSPFRGLPTGFNITFQAAETNKSITNAVEPICLVGLNGSGKSNLLEVIAELFYYLENYQRTADKLASIPPYEPNLQKYSEDDIGDDSYEDSLKEFKTQFGFVVEYAFDPATWTVVLEDALRRSEDWIRSRFDNTYDQVNIMNSLDAIRHIDPKLHIHKRPGELPKWDVLESHHEATSLSFQTPFMPLPRHIVGYSSGLNELLSNPFIRMNMHYVEDNLLYESQSEQTSSLTDLDLNRLLFIDYEVNKAVLLANYLFPFKAYDIKSTQREVYPRLSTLNQLLNINYLDGFRITLRLPARIQLNKNLDEAIQKLRRCATLVNEHILKDGRTEIRMDFKAGTPPATSAEFLAGKPDAVRQAFMDHFSEPANLFQSLYLLQLLNVRLFSSDLRERVKKPHLGENLSDLLPKYEEQQLLFSIGDIALRKTGAIDPVYYQQLSDGEHQLLHVMGILMLLNAPGTLFLLDEPETHFNPEWRSRFISLLNEVVHDPEWDYYNSEEDDANYNYDGFEATRPRREQDVLLTSHSPFIVSDCKPENVFAAERNLNREVIFRRAADADFSITGPFNTLGASESLILEEVFKWRNSISDQVRKRIEAIKASAETLEGLREGRQELLTYGESIEKFDALTYLNKREKMLLNQKL